MKKENTLHLVLVCHTEMGLDSTWKDYDTIQPQIDGMVKRVLEKAGKAPKITFCVTNEFLTDKLDECFRLIELGHEIGIHSHLPGSQRNLHSYKGHYTLKFDENGYLNQDKIAGALRRIAIELGIPKPVTHVSGMFSFQKRTIEILSQEGFLFDCSLIPNGKIVKHPALGDFEIADNRNSYSAKAYRPSLSNPWIEGNSKFLEIPVSGNLGCAYFEMENVSNLTDEFEEVKNRANICNGNEIYQNYWHHFEFSKRYNWVNGDLDAAEDFLMKCAGIENLVFSTAKDAGNKILEQETLSSAR